MSLTEGETVQYGTTTGGFQQNFGVFTNFNNVFYDLLLSYFMPGFEQICRVPVANYRENIQLSTTVLQYLQPDLSFSSTLALPPACWTSPTSTSWVSDDQIDHLDHAMTQTMANQPRTEVKER